jgi:putative ABC transport system permease protein
MRRPVPFALRLALWLCPGEFRALYGAEIARELREKTSAAARIGCLLSVAGAGLGLRAENVLRDLTLAVRSLLRGPLFTAIAILAIAVAVASNVAVVSVIDGVLLSPLPYPHADRLVFASRLRTSPSEYTYPRIHEIQARTRTFAHVGALVGRPATLFGHGRPVALYGISVTEDFFPALGVAPQLGRLLDAHDRGSANAVISAELWRRYYGADPAALGRTLRLDDRSYTIVGVLAPGFRFAEPDGLYETAYVLPADPRAASNGARVAASYDAIVRLAGGVALAAAQADFQRVLDDIDSGAPAAAREHPAATLTPVAESIAGPVRPLLLLLYFAVCIVFVIAVANVANIALVRAVTRARELALRSALGATRRRIAAQLLTESAVLALAGGALGSLGGVWAVRAFAFAGAQMLPRWENVGLSAAALLYALVLVALATVITGVLPALAIRHDLAGVLKASGNAGEGRSNKRARSALVVTEVALAMAVVVSAGLVLRSFAGLVNVDPGFDARGVLALNVNLAGPRFDDFQTQLRVLHRLASNLRSLPGVSAVAISGHLPFSNDSSTSVAATSGAKQDVVPFSAVGADFFRALRIPIVRGRAIDERDRPGAPPAAMVNAAFARAYFGTLDVVGKRIYTGTSAIPIVGVAANTRNSLTQPVRPRVFLPIDDVPGYRVYQLAVRTDAPVSRSAIDAAAAVDPALPPPTVRRLSDAVVASASRERAVALIFGALALVALLLSVSGIYAVTAYSVERRTREFGIRKAVGARARDVVAQVVGAALAQSAAGIALGLALSAAFGSALTALLYDVSPLDPVTFAAAVALLIACTIAAAATPSIRAMRVQPAVALRYE